MMFSNQMETWSKDKIQIDEEIDFWLSLDFTYYDGYIRKNSTLFEPLKK